MPNKIIGIPDKSITTVPRQTTFETWEGVIQYHKADKAGPHYDIRIGDSSAGIAHSWSVRELPKPGEKVLAIQQPDHSTSYMDYEGTIEKGYGKGSVEKVFRGKIELLKSEPDKISFNLYDGKKVIRLNLIKVDFGWLLVNSTLTNKSRPDIPMDKPSYPNIEYDKLDFSKPSQVFSPKIDGAHNIVAFRPNKTLEVSSYRPSKGKTGIIDHSYRTNLYKILTPSEFNNTLVRTEIFGVTPEGKVSKSTETSGLLNSEVWKTRESKAKLNNMLIDVIKYKGKDVSKRPYADKLKFMQEISNKISELKMPPLAKTEAEKLLMVNSIAKGKNPLTEEGIVIYDLEKSVPLRAKIRKDIDVHIQDFFPGQGRLADKMVGGFFASRGKGGPPIIRVGSGLSDELRADMFKNPEKYKNRLAKIYIQNEYPSGKVRVPIFKEFRDVL